MPSNNIAFARNYTSVIDEVYQRASVSGVLNSGRRMVRAGHNAKEILIPKISVTGLGNYTRNVGYKTGAITYEFETKTFSRLARPTKARGRSSRTNSRAALTERRVNLLDRISDGTRPTHRVRRTRGPQ